VTGVGTVKEDDPSLNVRDVDTQRQPVRIIIDSKLETPPAAKILQNPDQSSVIIVCASLDTPEMQAKAKSFEECGIEVITMANAFGKVDLPALFSYLAKEREMIILNPALSSMVPCSEKIVLMSCSTTHHFWVRYRHG
jgi:diaminohydroxyphosphoribosylaminopyrimidine deaminase/5-amino-6-(5-phosphoribosylamino)uracil reductase